VINIEVIRSNPEAISRALATRGEAQPIKRILELDSLRRQTVTKVDSLRSKRNEVSRQLGKMKQRPTELIKEMRGVGRNIKELEEKLRETDLALQNLLLSIPNVPSESVPVGEDETGNSVVRSVGNIPSFEFTPLPHWDLGEQLDIIDFKRGVKLAGSRFYVLKGQGARLQRALITWMLDLHVQEHGYQELYLPDVVNQEVAISSGQLPKFHDNMYHDDIDDLWLVPTAEVPITGLHADEILDPDQLPINYVAHTPSFRREKAAAGKDTRGIKRVHQFEKVEMYKFVEPKESDQALDDMISDAEDICERLGLPYRIVQLCTADIGFAAIETYDVEVWAAGSHEWLEVSSCSNCGDFQARRANIRYRPKMGDRPLFVHTLNGSGLGLPRVLIAILENYQQADGTITIPEILRPYTGFEHIK